VPLERGNRVLPDDGDVARKINGNLSRIGGLDSGHADHARSARSITVDVLKYHSTFGGDFNVEEFANEILRFQLDLSEGILECRHISPVGE
jgi:hypothetical protein